jgi:hypothetical protein
MNSNINWRKEFNSISIVAKVLVCLAVSKSMSQLEDFKFTTFSARNL